MRYEDIQTWDDFEEYAKSTSPEAKAEMERLDRIVEAIVFASDSLNKFGMGLELYNLDEEENDTEEKYTETAAPVQELTAV
ncbi:MAG: hypothetical protein IJP54_06480 [Synergistaceae bacterium]|nr:hypothetical protein [Synergistaceae bacterium]MBR0035304.1 hypothetical protein [Synergistaceae bacterium]